MTFCAESHNFNAGCHNIGTGCHNFSEGKEHFHHKKFQARKQICKHLMGVLKDVGKHGYMDQSRKALHST